MELNKNVMKIIKKNEQNLLMECIYSDMQKCKEQWRSEGEKGAIFQIECMMQIVIGQVQG
jgi:hypothetical protein